MLKNFPEFKWYPEDKNIKSMFIYKSSSDAPRYNCQSDHMLHNKREFFKLDWYSNPDDKVFRHSALGYNDCFFHSVLTDIDEKYRRSDEDERLAKVLQVRSIDLKNYLTMDVWKQTKIYTQLLECVKEQLQEKYRNYKEEKILGELYNVYLERITQACNITETEDDEYDYGIQVDEYMLENTFELL